jgi:hypothetical protein
MRLIMKASNYETDFYTWTQQQAALLKAGRLSELDVENIIEEIETMGRSEKRSLESRLTVLLQHLLKWEYQPQRRGRSWSLTIREQRLKFVKLLNDNPGLKPQLADILRSAYEIAVLNAANETNIDEIDLPSECPWTLDQITDQAFFPGGES